MRFIYSSLFKSVCLYFKPRSEPFFFLITFWLLQWTVITREEPKSMNSSGIVYSYLSTPIGKLFLFYSLLIKPYCHKFFNLSLATTVTVLTPVWCDDVTSIIMIRRRERNVDHTCWCHLSNIITYSIFHVGISKADKGLRQIGLISL